MLLVPGSRRRAAVAKVQLRIGSRHGPDRLSMHRYNGIREFLSLARQYPQY